MKPQDFLVGIRDFFSVVVPGAIFLLCIPPGLISGLTPKDNTLALFGAAVAAYLSGSIASALASILDIPVDGGLESNLAKHWWKKLGDREALAGQLKSRLLDALSDSERAYHSESLKAFWWGHLRLCCPAAIAELDRIEAAQKLFRSLVPVFAGLALWSWTSPHPGWTSRGFEPHHYAAAAVASFVLYVVGRAEFLSTVYRYAAAYSLASKQKPGA